jgi:hypothetical protein
VLITEIGEIFLFPISYMKGLLDFPLGFLLLFLTIEIRAKGTIPKTKIQLSCLKSLTVWEAES